MVSFSDQLLNVNTVDDGDPSKNVDIFFPTLASKVKARVGFKVCDKFLLCVATETGSAVSVPSAKLRFYIGHLGKKLIINKF